MMSKRWEQSEFYRETTAWADALINGMRTSPEVSLEFSNWVLRSGYIARRYPERDLEVHIVWSQSYGCPLLLVRAKDDSQLPKLSPEFVGGFEYHPVLDQVFYSVHGCETRTWMAHMEGSETVPGLSLLSWWSVIANRALNLGISPSVFVQAKLALEDYAK